MVTYFSVYQQISMGIANIIRQLNNDESLNENKDPDNVTNNNCRMSFTVGRNKGSDRMNFVKTSTDNNSLFMECPTTDSDVNKPCTGHHNVSGDTTSECRQRKHVTTIKPAACAPRDCRQSVKQLISAYEQTGYQEDEIDTLLQTECKSVGFKPEAGERKEERVTFGDHGHHHSNGHSHASFSRVDDSKLFGSSQAYFQNPLVTISPPDQLMFYVSDDTQETQDIIILKNNKQAPLAFKVKTTNPEGFRIRPSRGILQAAEHVELHVYLRPDCIPTCSREKFLIMVMQVDDDTDLSAMAAKWQNPNRDPLKYFEYTLTCGMRLVSPDSTTYSGTQSGSCYTDNDLASSRVEQSLQNIERQAHPSFMPPGEPTSFSSDTVRQVVHDIKLTQQQLDARMWKIHCLVVFLLVLVLLAFALYTLNYYELFPFTHYHTYGSSCWPYSHWMVK